MSGFDIVARPRVIRLALLTMMVVGLVPAYATTLSGQVIQSAYDPRDDQYRILGLVRAQAEYERAAAEHERGAQLFERGLISEKELADLRQSFERARVNYLQQSLAVIFASPHVTIDRAVKSRAPDGKSYVRLTLRNTTGGGMESDKLSELIEEDLLERLKPEEISNVYVSLKVEPGISGAIISSPYEHHIATMRVGEPVTLRFRLLRDVEEVVVSVNYADKIEEKTVFLEKDASANIVTVQSVQFSQEADLGGQATYDLQLERFTGDENVFRLVAVGLPRDILYEFRDPDTGARLNQIRFPEGQSQKDLQLVAMLPQRSAESFGIDEPIRFWVLAMDESSHADLRDSLAAGDTSAIEAVPTGKASLELVPRGVGRVELRALNLYHEIRPADAVTMDMTVRNTGSRRLDNLRFRLEAPLGWEALVEPEFISELAVDAESRVTLTLTPPVDVMVGDYEARLRTVSAAADRLVETEDKTIRVHVAAAANWLGTGLLLLALLGLVVGVVVFGMRLARR
jgi:hypothetical protein